MARTSKASERREAFLPIVVRTFAEFGYRRTTTAELAKRLDVRENILYRLWSDKKAMFIASIEYVYNQSVEIWKKLLDQENTKTSTAEQILAYEANHHGEFGLYRIIFAGLSEVDEPEIRKTLKEMYARFHSFVRDQIAAHHEKYEIDLKPDAAILAWAILGLGTVANISRELGMLTDPQRKKLISEAGQVLLEGGKK
jgi:AcrR family transcriptional regulator